MFERCISISIIISIIFIFYILYVYVDIHMEHMDYIIYYNL